MDNDALGEVSQTLDSVAPFLLIAAAGGAAAAGMLRRTRLAWGLMTLAVVALVVPLAVGMWWVLTLPPT